jgi:hypothetical protein
MLIASWTQVNGSLGKTSGLVASATCLFRAIGFVVSGRFYSRGLRSGCLGLPWWLSGLVTIVGALISFQANDCGPWVVIGADDV